MTEIWTNCTVADGYAVSSKGRVYSQPRTIQTSKGKRRVEGRFLKPGRRPSGHVTVNIGGRSWDIHQLVLRAFVGAPPDGMMCRHLNGVPDDNRLENLTYGTRGENMQDRKHHGVINKLTVPQIRDIKTALGEGKTLQSIADRFDVSVSLIHNIKQGGVHADV